MFTNSDSSVWTFFAEVCSNGDLFRALIKETRGRETKTVERGAGTTWPYSGRAAQR